MVRLDDLLIGIDWVGTDPTRHSAYVSRTTGQVHWASEDGDLDEELPEDIDDASKYVLLPSKQDLNLGRALALQFIRECLPGAIGQATAIFHHRGAYAKFKTLLVRQGLLDAWHAYEAAQSEQALRAWAAEEGITVDPPATTA